MRVSLWSAATTSMAIAAAGVIATSAAALPVEPQAPPTVQAEVRLSAAATAPPLGAPIEQFVVNQLENCSLICPFIVQGLVEVPTLFAILPLTLVQELQQGVPFIQAALLSDATVSGALNNAVTHIIDNDLNLVLPRAQNALEVAVVGLIDLATTAVTQPANIVQAFNDFRAVTLDALTQPPGTMPPPPVHNALEAAVVRTIEVTSALVFQAPERLLLGLTQAGDAFFRTIGTTGDIGKTLQAVGTSVSKTINDSAAFINHAFTEPIPVTPLAAAAKTPTQTLAASKASGKSSSVPKAAPKSKPVRSVHKPLQSGNASVSGASVSRQGNHKPRGHEHNSSH